MADKRGTIGSVAAKAKNIAAVGTAVIGMNTSSPIDNTPEKYAQEAYRANIVESKRQREIDSADKATPKENLK
jgi:hypothetical protein